MRAIYLIICLLVQLSVFAGKGQNTLGARSYGLAGSSILFHDFWSAENNPAGLAHVNEWGAGFSYENHFLLREFANKGFATSYPTKNGAFGLSISQFGFNVFNENKIGLSYGQKLGEKLSMGIQVNYLSTQISEGYGNSSSISGNIGIMADITDELRLAAVLINPNQSSLSEYEDERYPSLLKLGLSYSYSEKVIILSEVVKDIDFDADLKVGIEYHAVEMLYLRLGYATNPAFSTFGFGLDLQQFKLDFASGYDARLGFSPQISLSFQPK